MKTKIQFRDLLALPVWILANRLERLALAIGGKFTARMILGAYEKQGFTQPNNPK